MIVCTSCNPFYLSQTPITPLFTTSKQAEINLNTGLNGFNISAAYSFDSNAMFTLNGFDMMGSQSGTTINRSIQGGVGYFKTLNKSKSNISTVFEVEGGIGLGKADVKSKYIFSTDFQKGNFNKIYAKLALGSKGDYHKISIQSYFSYVNPYNLKIDNNSIGVQKRYVFFEPSISFSFGIRYIKFNYSTGLCLPLNYSNINNTLLMSFNIATINLGIGVMIPSIK